jgi:hypothetical protein
MIPQAADDMGVRASARYLGAWPKPVPYWRKRWRQATEGQSAAERLADLPRSGAPATSTVEQICAIVSTCEKSSDSERPISQPVEPARDCWRGGGIVEDISQRTIGRFLKKSDLKPRRVRYWLTPKPDADSDAKCTDICEIYKAAVGADDTHRTISIDEMTGIQALEGIAPGSPMLPGKVERRGFEYRRHGTQTLIAAFNVSRNSSARPCRWRGDLSPYRPFVAAQCSM